MKINLKLNKKAFNKVYLPYLDNTSRYLVFYGSAGSGKSRFAVQRQIVKALNSKRKVLVVRKVGATLRDSIYEEYLTVLGEWGLYEHCRVNRTRLTIKFPNGSELIFKGLDDREKIKSISGIDDIMVEEATDITKDDFTQLNLRLRSEAENQQIVLMYNPTSKTNWVYKYWHLEPPKEATVVKTTYKDNEFLPPEYIKELEDLKRTNPTYYTIYALGEFASLEKLIFNNWEIRPLDVNDFDRSTLSVGVDFGFTNDLTTITLLSYDVKTRTVYILDEVTGHGLLTDDIEKLIRRKRWHIYRIVADSSEPRLIRELQIKGLGIRGAKKGKNSIMHGISFLQQQRVVVDPKCENVIVEKDNYSWKRDKKTEEYINEPIDTFNHSIDGIRYALEIYSRKRVGARGRNLKQILGL